MNAAVDHDLELLAGGVDKAPQICGPAVSRLLLEISRIQKGPRRAVGRDLNDKGTLVTRDKNCTRQTEQRDDVSVTVHHVCGDIPMIGVVVIRSNDQQLGRIARIADGHRDHRQIPRHAIDPKRQLLGPDGYLQS